jgi:hypothetical protein
MSFDGRQAGQSTANGWKTFRMVYESCEGPARVMCLANSLSKKPAGLMEQLSISLLCNIWCTLAWVLANWFGC